MYSSELYVDFAVVGKTTEKLSNISLSFDFVNKPHFLISPRFFKPPSGVLEIR